MDGLLDIEKVRTLRERLGLTQAQAAAAAGFKGRQAWNNVESGRQSAVTLATLAKLAAVLRVSARELLIAGEPHPVLAAPSAPPDVTRPGNGRRTQQRRPVKGKGKGK